MIALVVIATTTYLLLLGVLLSAATQIRDSALALLTITLLVVVGLCLPLALVIQFTS